VQVLVRDDGIGVPESQKPRLFQKFFRAENAKKERPSGNGIGLYVAKKVIEEHGGKIIFQSTQGHGSTFGFFLPFKPAGYETKKPVEAQADKSIPQAV
jgi:signal transduction histidine kinase